MNCADNGAQPDAVPDSAAYPRRYSVITSEDAPQATLAHVVAWASAVGKSTLADA
jgi:hypothetical protein